MTGEMPLAGCPARMLGLLVSRNPVENLRAAVHDPPAHPESLRSLAAVAQPAQGVDTLPGQFCDLGQKQQIVVVGRSCHG